VLLDGKITELSESFEEVKSYTEKKACKEIEFILIGRGAELVSDREIFNSTIKK
jgi:hypothetical protein